MKELAEYYSLADVYVNLSVEETLGMTTLESQSCGTPVIVYNATACPEAVSQKTGLVVTPHDIKQLVADIKHITQKKSTTFFPYCRNWVEENFNNRNTYQKYFRLYQKILGYTPDA